MKKYNIVLIKFILLSFFAVSSLASDSSKNPFIYNFDKTKHYDRNLKMIIITEKRKAAIFGSKIVTIGDKLFDDIVINIEYDKVTTYKDGVVKIYKIN